MRRMIDTSRGECLGFVFGFTIACSNDQGYIQNLLMQHKGHLLQNMEDNSENTTSLKFVHELMAVSSQEMLDEYHLEDITEEEVEPEMEPISDSEIEVEMDERDEVGKKQSP